VSEASALPDGYVRVAVGPAALVCRADLAGACTDALRAAPAASPTLHAWAGAHPARCTFHGRAPTYAAPLPGTDVVAVVRHGRHGGLLAPLTRDLFVTPTRAPRELATSRTLQARGIRTPELLAYVLYPAPLGLRRVDVATRLVDGGRDLARALTDPPGDADVRPWVRATAALLHAMGHAGARHPDLNFKNVLLTPAAHDAAAFDAWVLDVDVLRLAPGAPDASRARSITAANLERLERSLRKAEARWGLSATTLELAMLRALALRGPDARVDVVWRPGHNVGPT
jgi:hypothetical protein